MSVTAMRLSRRGVLAILAAAGAAAFTRTADAAAAAAVPMVLGKTYVHLSNPQPVETGKKIEVIEFFSYGCPHCAALEPFLDAWRARMPADVAFRRVPVMFHEQWTHLARIYYTLDALGDEAKLSPEVFKAIHGEGLDLSDDKKFLDWAASKGLDRAKVEAVFKSFAVDSKMKRAMQLGQDYRIESVPTVIIDGKFMTSSEMVGTHAALPGAIDELIVMARAARAKG